MRRPRAWALAMMVALLMAAVIALQAVRDARYPRDVIREAVLYVPSGPVLKRMALSHDALLADVYWIRALQHFGGTRLSEDSAAKKYELLEPLLRITTELDPLFNIAYRFGAIFLSEPYPGGPGRPDQAVALLERGLEARPDNWRYMQDIGFIHYWWLNDYEKAAAWFEKGAGQPGAPWWLRSLAANTLAVGGDRQASRALWTAMLESADNDWMQRDAARRLQQLDALDQVDALQTLVGRYVMSTRRQPGSWAELVRAGVLRGVPVDPAGAPYQLEPESGVVAVAPDSPLQPMPAEPPTTSKR